MLAFHQDQERLAALDRYDVLDTPKEEAFDRITRLTKKIFNVPIAAVSVVDGHRQWLKSCTGIDAAETPREHAFCSHTIQRSQPLIVPDATKDPRFAQNPYVIGEPHVRFYAGIPLETADGQRIGALCAVDTKPREMAPDEVEILSDLARMVMDELELRVLATTDSLTGALSRRGFKDEARRATMLALRHHHDLSCVMFDLDHFKAVNDRFGHGAGD
ncbi:MAG TPA: GAF domain-containing protein, partial [Afifellaceae bacterium]|nr:GAF domain-containing protein [Afifellaceae bacterium]